MGGLLGKSKKNIAHKVTEADMAVLQLKQQRDKLKQYQRRVLNQLDKEKDLAKELVLKGRKDRALLILKKKKFLENMVANSDSLLEHVETQLHDIQFAQIQTKVLAELEKGNQALRELNKVLSIDRVEAILDETREGIEKQQEIDQLISGAIGDEDESALLEELERMEKAGEQNLEEESLSSKRLRESQPKEKEEAKEEEEEEEDIHLPKVPRTEPKEKVTQPQESKKAEALLAS
ncbi:vacuolar protein sorting 20 [Brevipalpus obovatus]|uniref:vacuolar protein sorting 20 n=1 Tax=Brevipalpus obovatus TaxID=246614 RepID=UPI003D9F5E38